MAWKEKTQVKYKYLKFVLKYSTWANVLSYIPPLHISTQITNKRGKGLIDQKQHFWCNKRDEMKWNEVSVAKYCVIVKREFCPSLCFSSVQITETSRRSLNPVYGQSSCYVKTVSVSVCILQEETQCFVQGFTATA